MSFGANLMRAQKPMAFTRGMSIRGFKMQRFILALRNSGGVIQVAFVGDSLKQIADSPPNPELTDRIIGATNVWQNLPALSASVGFGGVGAGTISGAQYLYFNTRPQLTPHFLCWSNTIFYMGNNTRVTPYLYVADQGGYILGSGAFPRPVLLLCNDTSSGYPLFNTAWLPLNAYAYFGMTMWLS